MGAKVTVGAGVIDGGAVHELDGAKLSEGAGVVVGEVVNRYSSEYTS